MSNLKSLFKKIRQIFQMKLVWKLRRRIFFQKIGRGIALINVSLYIFLFGALVWGFDKIIPFIKYIQDPSIATLIGAVVGALVGGLFAYIAAVDVHKSELEATAALKRRDEIYRPLYDELTNLRNDFQDGLPSMEPSHSILSRTFSLEHLPFSESKTWLQHYREIKFQIIPVDLADAMNELIVSINLGRQTENTMLKDKEFRKLIKKHALLWAKYDNESEVKPEVYLEEDAIFYEMEQLNSYVNFYKTLEEFFVKLSEIIDYLEGLIRYINNRFQQGANWY